MITNQTKKTLLSSIGLLSVAGLAVADDTTSGYSGIESMDAPKVEQKLQINPGFTYVAETEFDNNTFGKVSVSRFDVPIRYTMKMEQGELGLGAFYEFSSYDFTGAPGTEDFNTLAFDAIWKSMFNDKWGYFVYGGVGFSASEEASLGDGATGVGAGGVRYVVSPTLSFGLGVGVASQLEDDPSVLPIINVNWQINDRWNLRVLNGAVISYDISGDKKFLVDAGIKYQRRQYRLEQGSSALIETMVTVEAGATYHFTPNFGLRGFVGVSAARNFEIRADSDKVADEDADTAPYFGVRALMTF